MLIIVYTTDYYIYINFIYEMCESFQFFYSLINIRIKSLIAIAFFNIMYYTGIMELYTERGMIVLWTIR